MILTNHYASGSYVMPQTFVKTAESVKCYSLKSQISKNSDLSSGLELTFVPSSTSKFGTILFRL